MTNLKRKLERKDLVQKRKEAKKKLASKIRGIFLPDECSMCKEPFDKKSKEMALTWHVIAHADHKALLCPTCWPKISLD